MLFEYLGRSLARYLSQPRTFGAHPATNRPECLRNTIRKGDVLLVEGNSRLSSAIKYLTESTWSHAALCVGDIDCEGDPFLVEVDVVEGVRGIPLTTFAGDHTRICRPVGLDRREIDLVADFVIERLGYRYDLRNIFDLARYLLSTPPVPERWRRRLLALGN